VVSSLQALSCRVSSLKDVTIAETMEIAQDVARKIIESRIAHGDPISPQVHIALSDEKHELTASIPVSVPEVSMQ
jgi:hypothetical protein